MVGLRAELGVLKKREVLAPAGTISWIAQPIS
jgi:hypothetical protein